MSRSQGVQLLIGHDLDGNLGDWENAVRRGLASKGYDHIADMEPATSWNAWLDWGLSTDEFFKVYAELIREGVLETLELFEGQTAFLQECAKRGHKNIIVTNRLLGIEEDLSRFDTLKWVQDNLTGAFIDGVIFSADKNIVPCDIFFDDSVDNIDNLLNSGCPRPVLVNQPYNQDREDLDALRCDNTAVDKMAVVLGVEDIMGQFSSVGNAFNESNIDSSMMEPIRAVAAEMEVKGIATESAEGQLMMERAYEEVARQMGSVNNRLRMGNN